MNFCGRDFHFKLYESAGANLSSEMEKIRVMNISLFSSSIG